MASSISQGLNLDANNNLNEVLSITGQQQAMTVSTTAVVALGGSSALAGRKTVAITPTTGQIFWGVSSSVTTATGHPMFPNNTIFIDCQLPIYLIAASSTTVIVSEIA